MIDSHQHFWRYTTEEFGWISDDMSALRRTFLTDDLLEAAGDTPIRQFIAVQARQTVDDTSFLLDLADAKEEIVGVVGWLDLCDRDVEDRLLGRHTKLVGLRHILQSEPDDEFMLRPAFQNGLRALTRFELTYDILIYPRHLNVAGRLISAHERQNFVLDHGAKPDIKGGDLDPWRKDMRELAKRHNVWCKISGLVTEADWESWTPRTLRPYLDEIVDCFSPERVMFGSDWPVCTVAGSYKAVFEAVSEWAVQFSPHERADIFGGAARAAYRL